MRSHLSDRGRPRLRTITIILATALLIAPAAALAGHQFNDVPASNVFHDDIDWMSDNGVTKGCNPPANTEYCPRDNVTREQMAAFMHRLETEGVFLPADGKAADADKLDGKNSTAFLGADGKAADADKFDGKDSAAFEQFGGTIPSGTTLTGNWYAAPSNGTVNGSGGRFEMTFPTTASAPTDISFTDSNMAAGTANGVDNDPECTGDADNPTAPAGKVCWYVGHHAGIDFLNGGASRGDRARGARLIVNGDGESTDQFASGSWAYTAP